VGGSSILVLDAIKHVIWPLWESCSRKDRNAFSLHHLVVLVLLACTPVCGGSRTERQRASETTPLPCRHRHGRAGGQRVGRRQKARQPIARRQAAYWVAVETNGRGRNPDSCPPLDHVRSANLGATSEVEDARCRRRPTGRVTCVAACQFGARRTSGARGLWSSSSRSARRIRIPPSNLRRKLAGDRTRGDGYS